jgi:hypothetical protein
MRAAPEFLYAAAARFARLRGAPAATS